MSIYTRTGDKGETSLAGGKRLKKSHPIISLVGLIDELSVRLGGCVVLIDEREKKESDILEIKELVISLQKEMIDLGALAAGYKVDLNLDVRVGYFEQVIDRYEAKLPKLTRFILPGGSMLVVWFHLARTQARTIERAVVAINELAEKELILKYFNRLSDLLFTLARVVDHSVPK